MHRISGLCRWPWNFWRIPIRIAALMLFSLYPWKMEGIPLTFIYDPKMLAVHNRFKTSNMGWVGQIKDKREPVHHEAEAEGSLYCSVLCGVARTRRRRSAGRSCTGGLKGNELRKWKRAPPSASEASAFARSCELKARYYRLYNTMVGEGLTLFGSSIS